MTVATRWRTRTEETPADEKRISRPMSQNSAQYLHRTGQNQSLNLSVILAALTRFKSHLYLGLGLDKKKGRFALNPDFTAIRFSLGF